MIKFNSLRQKLIYLCNRLLMTIIHQGFEYIIYFVDCVYILFVSTTIHRDIHSGLRYSNVGVTIVVGIPYHQHRLSN